MKKIFIALALLVTVLFAVIFLLNNNASNPKAEIKSTSKKQEQFIVLLDLSDRIIQPGQIDADKALIEKTFEEFEKKVYSHLIVNSKDKFQVFIAPQKNLPFDKDIESDKLTLDLAILKTAERAKKLKGFKATLRKKLDSLYTMAHIGSDPKMYQGSNIWQFFNETLPVLTNTNSISRVIVVTDGYFDFEDNNAKLTNGKLSTNTDFMKELRKVRNWKSEIEKKGYGMMPVNHSFNNTFVCVSEIRSKFPYNLNESEMLVYVWAHWLRNNGISDSFYKPILHGSLSSTLNQLSVFLNYSI